MYGQDTLDAFLSHPCTPNFFRREQNINDDDIMIMMMIMVSFGNTVWLVIRVLSKNSSTGHRSGNFYLGLLVYGRVHNGRTRLSGW